MKVSLSLCSGEKGVTPPSELCYRNFGTVLLKARNLHKRPLAFAIITHKLDLAAMEAYRIYRLRDEQAKYFQQMKSQMVSDRQRNWSEEGKTGRLFVLFVSMIIGSYVRHIWESTELCKHFSSSLEVLDEMRSIRCIEHKGKAKHIAAFVVDQVRICEAFGFAIPKGCSPGYTSKQTFTHKRGRPRKKKAIERDY
jgi:hypothetical protein